MNIVLLLLNYNFIHDTITEIHNHHCRKYFLLHKIVFLSMQIYKTYSVFQLSEGSLNSPTCMVKLFYFRRRETTWQARCKRLIFPGIKKYPYHTKLHRI